MFQALYRKYRPQTFNDRVGQNHIVSVLKNAIDKDQISHAYLFYGSRGTGKTSIAKMQILRLSPTKNDGELWLDFSGDSRYNARHLGAFLDSTGMTRLQVHVEDERTS